jgi:hypothetical protein
MRDAARDRTLSVLGYRILRFANPDIDRNMEGVLETIRLTLLADINDPHPTSLRSAPLPEDGEGFYTLSTIVSPRRRSIT